MTGPVIETERLHLRPLDETDCDLAIEMFTDHMVARYVGGVLSREKIIEDFPKWMRRAGGESIGVWCILDKVNGEKLGTGVLLPMPVDVDDTEWDLLTDDEHFPDRDIEVGYILRRTAWGRGIATEVCRALLNFAFEQTPLDVIVACTDKENHASQHVLTKSGMRSVGAILAYGDSDSPGFEITREEWLANA